MVTSIKPWGNSQGLYIPKNMLKQLGLKTNDSVEMSISEDSIIIRKDSQLENKINAFKSMQEIRKEHTTNMDYEKELLEYLDERYLNA